MARRERQKVLIERNGRQVGTQMATVDPDDEEEMHEVLCRWMQGERPPYSEDLLPDMKIIAGSGFGRREVSG